MPENNFKLSSAQFLSIDSGRNALSSAAFHICRLCSSRLPDLSGVSVLLPFMQAATLLQQALLHESARQGHQALLLPRIMPIAQYAGEYAGPSPVKPLHEAERLLMLVSELRHHQKLYGSGSPWLLARNLLRLFDELLVHQVTLPDSTEEFFKQLGAAYHLSADNTLLQREARLVLTLWQAWHRQLTQDKRVDTQQHYLHQLTSSLDNIPAGDTVFMLGLLDINRVEQHWLEKLSRKASVTILRPGYAEVEDVLPCNGLVLPTSSRDDPYTAFLNACYDWQGALFKNRISDFRSQYPESPIKNTLHLLGVDNLEQHAQAIALYIRAALADNADRIGVVCEDRLLARRLRALLERSDINLHDAVGWALSTTYAAAILESWLICIELDFPYQAFLDLLKSPALIESDDDELLKLVYRFEHDIVLHEQKGSGIDRYINAIDYRTRRLENWSDRHRRELLALLEHFKSAAGPMRQLCNTSFKAAQAIESLINSLQYFTKTHFFQTDAAADQILQVLNSLLQAADSQATILRWRELRNWIATTLEKEYFTPNHPDHGKLILLTLQQSGLQHFDALVIAAADERHLPGNDVHLPFFNQSVRLSLGLPDKSINLRVKETLFRNLLQASPSILITWQKEDNGEPISASHWISAISTFHDNVYGQALEPKIIKQWLQHPRAAPTIEDANTPVEVVAQPKPTVGTVSVPTEITVSAHQRLIDCPYLFYVQDILRLKPLDEVREALQKSDYGNLVHQCLEAFHIGTKKIPGSFTQPLNADTREAAIHTLNEISQHVFSTDVENNYQHHAWLQRWQDFIPSYIDWQIEHAADWEITGGEKRTDTRLHENLTLRGRIDRLEQNADKLNVVDYKTGVTPSRDDIVSGEEVQLISYSFLIEHVTSVQYLGVDGRQGVNDKSKVEYEELETLKAAVKQRLIDLMQRIRNNEPMPAHGDDITCSYCDAAGICRKQSWIRALEQK